MERHSDSILHLKQIGGSINDIRGVLEEKVIPPLSFVYQSVNPPPRIESAALVNLLEQANIKSAVISNDPPAVGFGVRTEDFDISFYILYTPDTDDLIIHTFAFSSKKCLPELNQELLELNYQLKGGSAAIRQLGDRYVYFITHAVPLFSSRYSAHLVLEEVHRISSIQNHLRGILMKYSQQISPILLSEFIHLHNDLVKEQKELPSSDSTKVASSCDVEHPSSIRQDK